MIRYNKRYTVSEVLKHVTYKKSTDRIMFDGHPMKMYSQRYLLFLTKGCKCVSCGIEGTVFFKEKSVDTDPYHFNLYAETDGEFILMTKDHIVPVSKGGSNYHENYQVMCYNCNQEKGNKV